ncbi:MAG: SAM-dependent methyltransferase [Planctomycetota bacterium]|nr:MAG: SAM-dependent methyltransferase [Planctomycetota bacterium]
MGQNRAPRLQGDAMSERSSAVTLRHFDYIAARTAGEDDFLRRLKDEARAAGIPPIWIAPEQAALMQILLRAARAREVVEVGTLAGYSAICMARALPPDGRVRTIEVSEKHADFAESRIAASDVAERIEVHRGAGADVLPTFAANSADAAFLDADKASYQLYLRECLRIVRPAGLIMADNAFAFGQLFDDAPTDREALAVRAFNDYMATVRELQSIIIPIGDGLWVGVKL